MRNIINDTLVLVWMCNYYTRLLYMPIIKDTVIPEWIMELKKCCILLNRAIVARWCRSLLFDDADLYFLTSLLLLTLLKVNWLLKSKCWQIQLKYTQTTCCHIAYSATYMSSVCVADLLLETPTDTIAVADSL